MLARPVAFLTLIVVFAALATSPAQAAPRLAKVGDFVQPVHVTGSPGDFQRLYVVEQRGTIRVVQGGQALTFVDLSAAVRSPGDPGAGSEEGLLSVAFPFDFAQSGLFYVYFTGTDGNNHLQELRAPTGDTADAGSRREVMTIEHPGQDNHNGGQLQFGPDGLLYLAPGDGGGDGSPAQNLNSELGKILRIDPRAFGAAAYTVPADNPYVGLPGLDEIWSYGLRNPFRFSFDRSSGDLTVGDVGERTTEEIDYVPAAEGRGRAVNFGWRGCEGSFREGSKSVACPVVGARAPVIDVFQSDGWRAIIGGYVVNDPTLPSLTGRYVFADAAKGQLWSARLAVPKALEAGPTGLAVPGATSFGEDAKGCVYVTQLGGQVSRIVENDAAIPCAAANTPADERRFAPPRRTRLRMAVRVRPRQRVLRRRGAMARVRCTRRCSVVARGRLRIGERRYAMKRTVKVAKRDRRARVKIALTRKARRALRRALRRGRMPILRLSLRARDRAGNHTKRARRKVRVRPLSRRHSARRCARNRPTANWSPARAAAGRGRSARPGCR